MQSQNSQPITTPPIGKQRQPVSFHHTVPVPNDTVCLDLSHFQNNIFRESNLSS